MISKLRMTFCVGALAALAACGGTTVPLPGNSAAFPGDNLLPAGGSGRLSLSEIQTVAGKLAPGYNAASVTPKAAVPVSGSSNYLGYVAGDLTAANRVPVSGLAQVGVNFGTNRVGGTIGNFVDSQGTDLGGTLAIRNGVLNRNLNASQVSILGDVGGTLTYGSQTIGVDGRITDGSGRNGGFKGSSGQYIGFPMEGNISVNGRPGGTFGLNGVLGRTSR
ncbi:hypothetical protein ACOI1H_03750 [Loktanella sp. DJP18]|uniref:hypothetical protein n=1 Tax=Loktanella sp. DJP18 TaxID=3409788 RepID=UPI003BB742A3